MSHLPDVKCDRQCVTISSPPAGGLAGCYSMALAAPRVRASGAASTSCAGGNHFLFCFFQEMNLGGM